MKRPINMMTVAQLKTVLSTLPDDRHICITVDGPADGLFHIADEPDHAFVHYPAEDGGIAFTGLWTRGEVLPDEY